MATNKAGNGKAKAASTHKAAKTSTASRFVAKSNKTSKSTTVPDKANIYMVKAMKAGYWNAR